MRPISHIWYNCYGALQLRVLRKAKTHSHFCESPGFAPSWLFLPHAHHYTSRLSHQMWNCPSLTACLKCWAIIGLVKSTEIGKSQERVITFQSSPTSPYWIMLGVLIFISPHYAERHQLQKVAFICWRRWFCLQVAKIYLLITLKWLHLTLKTFPFHRWVNWGFKRLNTSPGI